MILRSDPEGLPWHAPVVEEVSLDEAPPRVPSLALVSLDLLRRAIRDEQLTRGHLRILANISEHMNPETLTAWPSRQRIGTREGMTPKAVGNRL